MATKHSNKTPIDKWTDKMDEIAEKFSIQATNRSKMLADNIMKVLDGYSINENCRS